MAQVSYKTEGGSPFRRLLAHNSSLLQAFERISGAVSNELSLPADLQEEVRRHLAVENGCHY